MGKFVAFRYLGTFNKQLRFLRVALYAELTGECQREFEPETAKSLAAQVVNYLTGAEINGDRNQIIRRAEDKMSRDKFVRKMIVYTLRMKTVLLASKFGEGYLSSPEMKRGELVLGRYGAEFPEEARPGRYNLMFSVFFEEKKKFISNAG